MFTLEFEEDGGYDGQFSAWVIKRNDKDFIVVDCSDFGQCCHSGTKSEQDYDKEGAEKAARICCQALNNWFGK